MRSGSGFLNLRPTGRWRIPGRALTFWRVAPRGDGSWTFLRETFAGLGPDVLASDVGFECGRLQSCHVNVNSIFIFFIFQEKLKEVGDKKRTMKYGN